MTTQEEMVAAILDHYGRATTAELEEGVRWYPNARRHARRMAAEHGITLTVAAGVIAALSPRIHWSRNLRMADMLLSGIRPTGVFGHSVRAAERILSGERGFDVLTGPKTAAFRWNILGFEHYVTIDVWAAKAAGAAEILGKVGGYGRIAAAYVSAAEHIGISPATLQATVWVVARGRAD